MLYTRTDHRHLKIVDLDTGRRVYWISANTNTGELVYYESKHESRRRCGKRYDHLTKTADGNWSLHLLTKLCAFNVLDRSGNVIDKARP